MTTAEERSQMPSALVTDAQERWVIAVCRSLARAGFKVTAAADSRPAVAQWSRFCSQELDVPPPQVDPESFVRVLERELAKSPYTLLVPCGEASLRAISEDRERLAPLVRGQLGLPAKQVVQAATDKVCLLEAAEAAELPCPWSILCSSLEEGLTAAATIGYPVVAKARSAFIELDGKVVWRPSAIAYNPEELATLTRGFGMAYLIQQARVGTVHSCAGVYADSRFIGFSLARYVRTWPPAAGNAAFAETIPVPGDLPAKVGALLRTVGWQGVFELELLRQHDGTFATLDLNPRMYGSLALAIRAGADLPGLWAKWLLGERPEPAYARPGVRYRWEDVELRRLVWELRHGRLRSALQVLAPRAGTVHPHFSWDDPAPIIARALYLGRRRLARHHPGFAPQHTST